MKLPNFLKPGDIVAIVATARKITQEELVNSLKFLEQLQLVPRSGQVDWRRRESICWGGYVASLRFSAGIGRF